MQVAKTTIPPYSWEPHSKFILTNDNKIAKPADDTPELLLSEGPQYKQGFSIEFTVIKFYHCAMHMFPCIVFRS